MIACAFTGPVPGSASSSSLVAVLMLTAASARLENSRVTISSRSLFIRVPLQGMSGCAAPPPRAMSDAPPLTRREWYGLTPDRASPGLRTHPRSMQKHAGPREIVFTSCRPGVARAPETSLRLAGGGACVALAGSSGDLALRGARRCGRLCVPLARHLGGGRAAHREIGLELFETLG